MLRNLKRKFLGGSQQYPQDMRGNRRAEARSRQLPPYMSQIQMDKVEFKRSSTF